MLIKRLCLALSVALAISTYPSYLVGQTSNQFKAKTGHRWIVFASREELPQAAEILRGLSGVRTDIRVFKSTSGWYTIAAGPLPLAPAQSTMDALITSGKASPDTYLSDGRRFVENVTAAAKSQSLGTPSQKEVEDALALLSAAFANPIEPRLRKEIRDGVMLGFNSTVYKQIFSGNKTRLRYTLTEEIKQETQAGLGGTYQSTSTHQGDIAFKDLQHAWIHEDERDPVKRRMTLNCFGRRECASWTGDGRSWKSDAVYLIFRDEQTAKDALLAIDILMRANKPHR